MQNDQEFRHLLQEITSIVQIHREISLRQIIQMMEDNRDFLLCQQIIRMIQRHRELRPLLESITRIIQNSLGIHLFQQTIRMVSEKRRLFQCIIQIS